jgi:hypothetical protein
MWRSWWNEKWQGKPKYLEKPAPVPLCPPQIPHDVTWARTWAAAVGSRRLTAWAMAWPFVWSYICDITRQELWLHSNNLWQRENMEIDWWFGDSSGMSCVRSEISYINLRLFSKLKFTKFRKVIWDSIYIGPKLRPEIKFTKRRVSLDWDFNVLWELAHGLGAGSPCIMG